MSIGKGIAIAAVWISVALVAIGSSSNTPMALAVAVFATWIIAEYY